MKFTFDSYKSVYLIHKDLTKAIFLARTGAKDNSYAQEVFARIFDCVHSELIDVVAEYEKYYKPEYRNVFHYLYHKLNMSDEQVSAIHGIAEAHPEYRIFRKRDFTYGDGGLEHFAFSDTLRDRSSELFLMKEKGDEEQI